MDRDVWNHAHIYFYYILNIIMINTHRGLCAHLVMIATSKNQRQKGNNRTPLNCADTFSSAAH